MDDEKPSQKLLRELFGDPIFEYTDDQAVADGVLVPFIAGDRDTGHRITANAFRALEAGLTPRL